ncbi:polysaccharide pyruvyl transferase family protein [bacterium]|nr:polysaccharide pyruvyl transferase family protein [bacterium]
MEIKPFFINSNICLNSNDICSRENFYNSIAGNIGNSYITYALSKAIFGGLIDFNHIQNIYTYDFNSQNKDISTINNECSHVFLILQDQIRINESYNLQLPFKQLSNFIEKINKPVIVAGLGANSFNGYDNNLHKKLNPELINFLKVVSEHTEVIGLRGNYTKEVLHKIGINNTQVIGCPSFFENGKDRILIKKAYSPDFKIALTGFPFPIPKNPNIKVYLQDKQDFEDKITKIIAFDEIHFDYDFESLPQNEYLLVKNEKYRIFSDIESWKKSISKMDFTYGSRLHGAILSINSGTCAIVTNSDTRANEMCDFLKIPYMPKYLKTTEFQQAYEECDFSEMNKNYPILYKNYENFLNKNGLKLYNGEESYQYIKQPKLNLYNKKFRICIRIYDSLKFMKPYFWYQWDDKRIKITLFGIKISFKK